MILFSKYKEINSFQAFNILKELENPNSKYGFDVYMGAIGTILLVNNWIVAPGYDEFLYNKLQQEIHDKDMEYYDLYIALKRTKFKAIAPSMLEAINNNDFLLFFCLCNFIKQKDTEAKIEVFLGELK